MWCLFDTRTRALKISRMNLTQSTMGVKFENHRIISNTETNIWVFPWWSIVKHPPCAVCAACVRVFLPYSYFISFFLLAFFVCSYPSYACARKRKQYHCLKFNWWKQEYLKPTYNNIFASCFSFHKILENLLLFNWLSSWNNTRTYIQPTWLLGWNWKLFQSTLKNTSAAAENVCVRCGADYHSLHVRCACMCSSARMDLIRKESENDCFTFIVLSLMKMWNVSTATISTLTTVLQQRFCSEWVIRAWDGASA